MGTNLIPHHSAPLKCRSLTALLHSLSSKLERATHNYIPPLKAESKKKEHNKKSQPIDGNLNLQMDICFRDIWFRDSVENGQKPKNSKTNHQITLIPYTGACRRHKWQRIIRQMPPCTPTSRFFTKRSKKLAISSAKFMPPLRIRRIQLCSTSRSHWRQRSSNKRLPTRGEKITLA